MLLPGTPARDRDAQFLEHYELALEKSEELRRAKAAYKITRRAREAGVKDRLAAYYKVENHRQALLRIARAADEAERLAEIEKREKLSESTGGTLRLEVIVTKEQKLAKVMPHRCIPSPTIT